TRSSSRGWPRRAAAPAKRRDRLPNPLDGDLTRLNASARVVLQDPDFFLEHLLNAVLGDKNISHGDSEFLCGVGAGEPLERGQAERFPIGGLGPFLDAMHGDLEELAVEGILELPL